MELNSPHYLVYSELPSTRFNVVSAEESPLRGSVGERGEETRP